MKSVQQYNGLNGAYVSRSDIRAIIGTAEKEEQNHIARKLIQLLDDNPNAKEFDVELTEKQTEILQESFLPGLEYMPIDDEENPGLSKPVSPDDIYQMITDKMISLIEKSTGKGYQKKWAAKGYMIPFNFVSKKPYRGINQLMLSGFGSELLQNPFYLTFKQVEKLGGRVKKGAEGEEVIYYNFIYRYSQAEPKLNFKTNDKQKFVDWAKNNRSKINVLNGSKKIPLAQFVYQSQFAYLRYYNVFSATDVEGIDWGLDNFKVGYVDNRIEGNNDKPIELAEAIVKNYPKPSVKINHIENGSSASYNYIEDTIKLPRLKDFDTALDYYRTLFHEITHSTGHPKRLDRQIQNQFGDPNYAKEELVAEFGAVFLSAFAGIMWRNNNNHKEYLAGWKNTLKFIKDDNKLLMRAASAAQKASDFILQNDAKGVPAFITEILKNESKSKKPSKKEETKPEISFAELGKDLRKELKTLSTDFLVKTYGSAKEPHFVITLKKDKRFSTAHRNLFEKNLGKEVVNPFSAIVYGRREANKLLDDLKKSNFVHKKQQKKKKDEQLALFGASDFSNLKEFAKYAYQWAKQNLTGKTYYHDEIKEIVQFKNSGVYHAIRNNRHKLKIQLIFKTMEMLKNSTFIKFEEDKKKRKEIAGVYRMKSFTVIDKKPLEVVLTLRKGENGVVYYDHKGIETKKLTLDAESDRKNDTQSTDKRKPLGKVKKKNDNSKKNDQKPGMQQPEPQPVATEPRQISNPNSLAARKQQLANRNFEYYQIDDPDISKFLGKVEIKEKDSVGISITAPQGAGKTRFLFQLINAFAKNYKVGHASMEEHPESSLYFEKVDEYISDKNLENIEAPEINTMDDLHQLIMRNDVIAIDSFEKLKEIYKMIQIDKDLRKKYDGKLFIIIFQLTSDGKMRGGSKSQFDVDIVLFTEKFDDYRKNYIYPDKNRYNDIPTSELKFNIYRRELEPIQSEETVATETQMESEPFQSIVATPIN